MVSLLLCFFMSVPGVVSLRLLRPLLPVLPEVPTTCAAPSRSRNLISAVDSAVNSAGEMTLTSIDDFVADLNAVREIRPMVQSPSVQASLWQAAGLNPVYKVSGAYTDEPSFTSLFNHKTWSYYTGRTPLRRWSRTMFTWRYSTVFAAVWPISTLAAIWAFAVASLPRSLLPRTSPLPMSFIGSALGLLLVFRTNNTYLRLSEARLLWGRAVLHVREIAQGLATALLHDDYIPEKESAHTAMARSCRLLTAWGWELNAKLTGMADGNGFTRDLAPGERADVLHALLPMDEAEWISNQRSRPLTLLGALRRECQAQFRAGNLERHTHRRIEEDIRALDQVVGGCERLFSSPLPPTMSRHVIRCLALWLLGLPFVLVGTMAPLTIAIWVFVTSYIFVGIEEVGVQVEQPFEIVPMTRICNVIMLNIEEAISHPPKSSS